MKKINKVIYFSKLTDKFRLSQGEGDDQLVLSEVVQPIFDIENVMRSGKVESTSGATTGRTDTYTVPTAKRWRWSYWMAYRTNASDCTIQVVMSGTTHTIFSIASLSSGQKDSMDIWLEAGDQVKFVHGTASNGDVGSTIAYTEYDQ